jgi:Inner membrane protein YgaP-like, transmembrane domain
MNALFRFLASSAGRITRVVAGAVLILVGLLVMKDTAGWIIAIIGLVPFVAGIVDVCVFAPPVGLPFKGTELRKKVQ